MLAHGRLNWGGKGEGSDYLTALPVLMQALNPKQIPLNIVNPKYTPIMIRLTLSGLSNLKELAQGLGAAKASSCMPATIDLQACPWAASRSRGSRYDA